MRLRILGQILRSAASSNDMKFSERKSHRPPAIIIISLIDILIVLLIFLMVTTTFRETPALSLTLPTSTSAGVVGETTQKFVITIAESEPYVYLGDRSVALDSLEGTLEELSLANPEMELSIRPDEAAPVGVLVDVIDAAKGAQISNFRLLTKRDLVE